MKLYFSMLSLMFLASIEGCKTEAVSPTSLPLLQHRWMLVLRYGEGLRYIGTPEDYFDFSNNSFLYSHVAEVYDTSFYQLLSDNRSLLMYQVKNGVQTNEPAHYHISVLDSAQLIMTNTYVEFYNIDSLRR